MNKKQQKVIANLKYRIAQAKLSRDVEALDWLEETLALIYELAGDKSDDR